jgi:hypothetical protein
MKIRINYPLISVILYYIVSTSFFGLVDNETVRIVGFKLTDLFAMVMLVPILLLYYYKRITISANYIYLMLMTWVFYVILEALVNSIFMDNVSFDYAIRSIRVYLYLAVFFLAAIPPSAASVNKLLEAMIWLDFISSLLYNAQFITGVHFLKGHYLMNFSVGGMSFIRGYTGMPVSFVFDICALLFLKNEIRVVRSSALRVLMALSIGLSCFATLTRGVYLVVCLMVSFYVFRTYVKRIDWKSLFIVLGYTVLLIYFITSPIVKDMAQMVVEDLKSPKTGNVSLRLSMLAERVDYLTSHDQLLFGIGPKSDSDPSVSLQFRYGVASQTGIVTDDIGMAGFLLQYGLMGFILMIALLGGACLVKTPTNKGLMLAAKLQVLAVLLLYFDSGSLHYEKTLFVIGVYLAAIMRNSMACVQEGFYRGSPATIINTKEDISHA